MCLSMALNLGEYAINPNTRLSNTYGSRKEAS